MRHVIMKERENVPNLQSLGEYKHGHSILRAVNYEKGGEFYVGHEYILYEFGNRHTETLFLGKITKDKGGMSLQNVTEYRDNQLVGGSITMERDGITVGEDTATAVQEAWNNFTTP